MTEKQKELVDNGFDSDFSEQRIDEICSLFGSEVELQEYIDRIHLEDNAIDMKRGEFYPEILRGIISMKRALSMAYGIDPGHAHPNFGCNGSIDTIMTAMKLREVNRGINPAKEGGMLVATPTYFRNYNSCSAKQVRMVKVPVRQPDWSFDLDGMLNAMAEFNPTVVFLVTPNNPTGIAIPDSDILTMLDAAPEDTLIVMDRTLVNINAQIATVDLLKMFGHKQLAILHSFSKYSGMSHLRTGFALYSNCNLADEIKPHLPLGLGLEGCIKATRILLKDGPIQPNQGILDNIRGSKEILENFCQRSGRFSCTDFAGNYCLLILPRDITPQQVVQSLLEEGIYIMGGHDFPEPVDGVVRLHTGGRPEYMEMTVRALEKL